MKFKLNEDLFEEDTTLKQAVQDLGDKTKVKEVDEDDLNKKTDIEEFLDMVLDRNLEQQAYADKDARVEPTNVLLVGPAGTGKTAIVKQWAKANNINLFVTRASDLERSDLGGIPGRFTDDNGKEYARKLASTEFDMLNRERSVLFLDEVNRAPAKVRGSLLSLVQDKVIKDPNDESGDHYFKNLLFTIAAMNPPVPGYDTEPLDIAERSRYLKFNTGLDNQAARRFLVKSFNADVEKIKDKDMPEELRDRYIKQTNGRKNLAIALLNDPTFSFDTPEETYKADEDGTGEYSPLDYRALRRILVSSDGTKDSFLKIFKNSGVGYNKYKIVDNILKNYKDVDDKANDALKKKSTNAVFNSAPKGLWAEIEAKTGEKFN